MDAEFHPDGLPVLIGSLPLADHAAAVGLVLEYTPEIPLWPQLPLHRNEGMMAQFLPGMPGVAADGGRVFVDLESPRYADELVTFYEAFISVTEGTKELDATPFVLGPETAGGFFELLGRLGDLPEPPRAVKGQVTGPITFCMGVKDRAGRAIFYDPQARDAAVKLLALKARWQIRKLAPIGRPVIVFLDEPALAGFGSSEMISVSREEIAAALYEVTDAVRAEGGLAGIHVCANTDWSIALDGSFDIVNFDAYAYFDKFVLYAESLKRFLSSGGILAWGIVPTLSPQSLDGETAASLVARWESQARSVAALGFDTPALLRRSLISPSCGAGSLDPDRAIRVLELTRSVSRTLRDRWLRA